jgi:RNA polymerase sigma-70 factor (ECF subfamily)
MLQSAEATHTDLLRRIAIQDRQALSDFYDQLAGVLFATAVKILGDSQEAEEVIQDVFVQIWAKAAAYDASLATPCHWALSIARNRSIDRLRARARRAKLLEELSETFDPPAPSQETAHGSLTGDDLAAIQSAVGGLPAEQRQAIELAFFAGMSHPEIAERLEEPLGTIKARIRRGMMKLRESLQPYL